MFTCIAKLGPTVIYSLREAIGVNIKKQQPDTYLDINKWRKGTTRGERIR